MADDLEIDIVAHNRASDEFDRVGESAEAASGDLERTRRSAEEMGESAGTLATRSAQVAGGLGDLGGAVAQLGGPFAVVGGSMELLGPSIMGITGAADLAEAAFSSTTLATIRNTAANVGNRTAQIASGAAAKTAAAGQWLLNAAMSANPAVLITLALIALIAVFVLLWQHSETFRAIVTGAFDAVVGAAQAAFGWVRDNWPLVLAILTGPIGLAVLAVTRYWGEITGGFQAVVGGVQSGVDSIVGFLTGLPGRALDAGKGLANGFIDGINWMIKGWNALSFTLPSVDTHIPGVGKIGGWSINTPDISTIPRLARGGVVVAGDNPSGIEAIVPLERADEFGFGGGGGTPIVIQMPASAMYLADKATVARWILDALAYARRQGYQVIVADS